jgi:hypothetical protein
LEKSIHLSRPDRSNTRLKFLYGSEVPFDKLDAPQALHLLPR